jgi:hypothetical protein
MSSGARSLLSSSRDGTEAIRRRTGCSNFRACHAARRRSSDRSTGSSSTAEATGLWVDQQPEWRRSSRSVSRIPLIVPGCGPDLSRIRTNACSAHGPSQAVVPQGARLLPRAGAGKGPARAPLRRAHVFGGERARRTSGPSTSRPGSTITTAGNGASGSTPHCRPSQRTASARRAGGDYVFGSAGSEAPWAAPAARAS